MYTRLNGDITKNTVEPEISGNRLRYSTDGKNNFRLTSGQQLQITYILRVSPAVVPGEYINTAQAKKGENPDKWSNIAREIVEVKLDELFDTTSIIGKVFHDRDKDGWQDDATAKGITINIIESEHNYVRNNKTKPKTTEPENINEVRVETYIMRDDGEWEKQLKPLDLLGVGTIKGRYGENMPVRSVKVRREIINPNVISKLIIRTDSGTVLFMDSDLRTKVIAEPVGEKLAGETAEDIRLARKIIEANGKYYEEIQIYNYGIYEEGIEGVKISTIRGEIITTDSEGRYHVKGIEIENVTGENFILKVDPNSLPRNAEFTTPNPMIKRLNKTLEKYNFGIYFN